MMREWGENNGSAAAFKQPEGGGLLPLYSIQQCVLREMD